MPTTYFKQIYVAYCRVFLFLLLLKFPSVSIFLHQTFNDVPVFSELIMAHLSLGITLAWDGWAGPGWGPARRNLLFDLIRDERWGEALSLLEKNSRRYCRNKARRTGTDGLLPLHLACWMGSSRPDGAPSSDGSSVSQISVATAHTSIDTNDGNTSSETDIDAHDQEDSHAEDTLSPETVRQQHNGVIRRLIEIFPLAMRNQHNLWGWTPLHMACYSSRSDAQTVRALVKAYPGACSMRDRQRLLPLHRACLMASQEVDDIVRALLLTDPSQVSTEIRNEDRDVPFHLVMARIHHEIQKLKFKPLRQKQQHDHQDHQDQAQSTDEANTWPFHEPHPQLEKLIEATFLILEADINGTIDTGYLTTQQKLRLLNHCMHQTRCPNHRLFVYMALWEHPELVMMGDAYADGNNDVMLHIAAKHTKREVADCHWCSTCNRGLADPHFVSQDSGESCDLNCAYKQRGGSGTRQEGVAKSWYGRYKNRMYKDVVLTTPCKLSHRNKLAALCFVYCYSHLCSCLSHDFPSSLFYFEFYFISYRWMYIEADHKPLSAGCSKTKRRWQISITHCNLKRS